MSTTPTGHAIKRAHNVIAKTGLALRIKRTVISDGSLKGLSVLKLTDMISYMVEHAELHRLLGGLPIREAGATLVEFWVRYRRIHPELDIYQAFDAGDADPQRTIPVFVHGDEGRGFFP